MAEKVEVAGREEAAVGAGAMQCAVCIGQHLANISSSACTTEQEQSYCNFKPSPWTPGGCCSRCPGMLVCDALPKCWR